MERKVWKECKKTRTEDRKKNVFLPELELLMYDNATWCFFYSAGKNWWLRRDFLQNTNTFFTSADVSKCVRAWKLKEHFESTHWRRQPPNKPLSGSSKSIWSAAPHYATFPGPGDLWWCERLFVLIHVNMQILMCTCSCVSYKVE